MILWINKFNFFNLLDFLYLYLPLWRTALNERWNDSITDSVNYSKSKGCEQACQKVQVMNWTDLILDRPVAILVNGLNWSELTWNYFWMTWNQPIRPETSSMFVPLNLLFDVGISLRRPGVKSINRKIPF